MSAEQRRLAEYRWGRDTNLAGQPRDATRSIDWLAGWDDAEADRRLDEDQEDA